MQEVDVPNDFFRCTVHNQTFAGVVEQAQGVGALDLFAPFRPRFTSAAHLI